MTSADKAFVLSQFGQLSWTNKIPLELFLQNSTYVGYIYKKQENIKNIDVC